MRWTTRILATALCAAIQGCATAPLHAPIPAPATLTAETPRAPVTILISIDGFRPDYRTRGVTPNLDALAAAGISAAMRPSFPSKTFPNHWTLATGLRPDRTGIVSNSIEDETVSDHKFTMEDSKNPAWWNAAEPIWVTAERGGVRSATMFWPGSNVAWGGTKKGDRKSVGGTRAEDWWPFDIEVAPEQRVAGAIDWLRRPAATRPRFLTLYFDTVDSAGHTYGPDSPEVTAAVAAVDGNIGALVAGLRELGQPANLVIVADHGMAGISPARTVEMDKVANPKDYRQFDSGPFASFYPVAGHERALEQALLGHHAHYDCWRKGDIPARFHYGANPRIPPYFCLPETGWLLLKTAPKGDDTPDRGTHGYDNFAPEMAALFITSGPAIKPLGTLAPFDNVDVAPLLRDLLGLPAGTGLDGDDAPFRAALTK